MGNAKGKQWKETNSPFGRGLTAKDVHKVWNEVAQGAKEINREKWHELLEKLTVVYNCPKLALTPLANGLFDRFDDNKNGKLDKKEFLSGMTFLCQGSTDDKLELTFKLYDADGSGTLSKAEIKQICMETLRSAFTILQKEEGDFSQDTQEGINYVVGSIEVQLDKTLDEAIAKFDVSGDGLINLEEFKALAKCLKNMKGTLNGREMELPLQLF